jgi:hypothetical protein
MSKCLKCKQEAPASELEETGLCKQCMPSADKEDYTLRQYLFKVTLRGIGRTRDLAWQDCFDSLVMDAGPTPELEETTYEGEV